MDVGDPEVGEQRTPAVLVEQNVRGLDIAMHDAAAVGVAKGVRDLAHAAQNRVGGCTLGAVEALLQGYAAHERHAEEGYPVFRIEVVHTDAAGMFEPGAAGGL